MNIADRSQIDDMIAGQNQDEWMSYTHDKNYTYVVDQQNGNYSNQVSWDLTSVVNQNSWMSIQEGYVLMPFSTTLALPSSGAATLTAPSIFTPNMVCLKNNFINFVDSLQLFVNGEQLIDQTTFSNMPLNLMDLLTMSQDDLALEGSALNITPDTTTSIRYTTSASVCGDGYSNNVILPSAAATTLTSADSSVFNNGLFKRLLNTSSVYPQATGTATTNGVTNGGGCPPAFSTTVGNFTQILSPYFSQATNSTAVEGCWNYVVYIPLKRLSDLLFKYPMVKGSQIRLVINFNAGISTITTDTSATNAKLKFKSYTNTAGNCNPVMLTSNYTNPITSTSSAGDLTITTRIQTQSVSRVATTTAQKGFAALPNCRVYIPNYKINPNYEERILANRVQRIRYIDWYQQPIINVSNSAQYSQVLTTALTNVKALFVIPFQNGSTSGNLFASATGSQWQSPFDSAPSTSMPGAMLAFQNFNVQVSGINIFNQNANYTYDLWVQEVQRLGLNGATSKELASGLIDLTTWNWSPFACVDLSRRTPEADGTYQSVVVSGTNNTGVAIDLYCFIAFEKEVEIDVLTGAVKRIF
jgi:hypothetical protein